jgi:hypothetical protein
MPPDDSQQAIKVAATKDFGGFPDEHVEFIRIRQARESSVLADFACKTAACGN